MKNKRKERKIDKERNNEGEIKGKEEQK